MHARAQSLIRTLELAPHPEGGHYRQIFRSPATVMPSVERGARPGLTTIYFLLTGSDISRWHSVASDEVWHFYEGDPLELLIADESFAEVSRHTLGPLADDVAPVRVAPAGTWQAARSLGDYTLVGCTVGPGFDFADFRMLRDDAPEVVAGARAREDLATFI